MVGSTSTFVSCKDYDDDIDGLQEQIDANKKQIDDILAAINGKKFIESYAPVEGGYLLTFTGGETLTIKNGAQGEKGEQGLQGIQGPKGETGATIVPKFKVDAESYWMISVDEGATYEYVLNDAGEKIKAAGSEADVEAAIGNYVKVDEEGYICIGEYKTSFKYNANVPSMIYNEKDGTMQVTIGGQSYTLLMEGSAFNAGSVIKWLRDELGIIESAPQCDRFAEMVDDSNGLYFVPAFTGLGAPYWDMYARGTMIGLTRGTNKYHLCRAVLDSIAFQMTDLLEAMKNDSNIVLKDLRVDGGASVSDILMQIQADVAGVQVNRPKNAEATALGAAYLAGLAVGVWKDTQEIEKNRQVQKIFVPAMEITKRNRMYDNWKRAVERSRNWER